MTIFGYRNDNGGVQALQLRLNSISQVPALIGHSSVIRRRSVPWSERESFECIARLEVARSLCNESSSCKIP